MTATMRLFLLIIGMAIIGACGYLGDKMDREWRQISQAPAQTIAEGEGWALLADGTKVVKEVHTYPWYDLGGQE